MRTNNSHSHIQRASYYESSPDVTLWKSELAVRGKQILASQNLKLEGEKKQLCFF